MIANKINNLIVTFFNVGYFKFFSGTFASLIGGIVIYIVLIKLNPSILLQCIFLLLLIFIAHITINNYQLKSNHSDPKEVVIDEVVGIYISLMFFNKIKIPETITSEINYFLLCFIFFRIFDGLKPSIIYRIQIQNTNSSILLDDVCAGCFTLIAMLCLAINNII